MRSSFLFSSESVSEGHPDKVADQISDAILDHILAEDPHGRVACETLVSTGLVVLSGEISTQASINYREVVQETIKKIGYDNSETGFDYKSCAIMVALNRQSPDIAQGVNQANLDQGAGDQGIMFGYACDETPSFMPFAIYYAHRIMEQQARLRHEGRLLWLRPDAKSQLTVRYEEGIPKSIDTVVVSTQHDPDISQKDIYEATVEEIIKPVLPKEMMREDITYHINPTGRFVIGGPHGDCGLTGRKIIVDTYGGSAHHGGGAFSGKDPSKVDRSAAYACRYVAKNIVKAGIARRCQIQIAYAIGVAHPVSLMLDCFGTAVIDEQKIVELIKRHFDLRPRGIIESLDLLRPIYTKTATYGHFGREDPEFSWEKTDKAAQLRTEAGLA